ncbi:T9SS type A sorting domain-containing protein [Pontibacter locisalis]|uniref:T9SS type A sorting domain-containing protein n=1 Tax=Pontibacter locisalis TaxID=1719035 RepID=A0ABW5IJR7_9BACT
MQQNGLVLHFSNDISFIVPMRTSTHLQATKFGLTSLVLTLLFMLLQHTDVQAQKYWRGSNSKQTGTDWNTAANWYPVGVPGPTDDVIIGDDGTQVGDNGFTSVVTSTSNNNPDIAPGSIVSIKSLTVGVGKAGKLLIGASDFNVSGDVTIGTLGEVENHGSAAYYGGSFEVKTDAINSGVYKETGYSSNPGYAWGNTTSKIWPYTEFLGTGKTIKFPSSSMGFSYLKISGSVKMLSGMSLIPVNRVRKHKTQPDVVIASDNPKMYVSGTFDPMEHKVAFKANPTFVVEQSGTIYVKAVDYKDNYAWSSSGDAIFPTIDPLGTVNYGRSTVDLFTSGDQNVLSSVQYGRLRISGNGIKILLAPTGTPLVQTTIVSDLFVDAGTLDIVDRSLNRTAGGGTMYVANNATFRLSGTDNFPLDFTTIDLGPTSTTEYYGDNQNIKSVKYGHLNLTGPSSTIAAPVGNKTMQNAAMVVSGNLNILNDASFTAMNTIQVDGNVTLSESASFNGGLGFTHVVGGNWTNNADFTGNTSTVRLIGTSKAISRTANVTSTLKNEFNNLEIAGLGTTITIPGTQTLVIKGNLSTTGAGTLSQSVGSLTMEGAAKTIAGNSIVLNDFIANGSTTTTTSFTVKGDFTVNSDRSFVATGGTVTMAGDGSKNINNNAATPVSLTFFGLRIDNTTLTSSSFYVDSDLSGNNLTAATAGTVKFRGATATFAGTHNLFDVIVSGTDRRMVTNSNMGVASTLTVSGLLNVTANIPNTVTYNGTIAQTVAPITYHHLVFDKAGNKLANNDLQVNGDITIKTGSNFYAGANLTHTLEGDWINYGYFYAEKNSVDPASSSLILSGTRNTSFTGIPLNKTMFKSLTVDKTSASIVSLNYDITTTDLNLTKGSITTIVDGLDPFAANPVEVRVTGERSGFGWVQGTIKRSVTGGFKPTVVYSFNAPDVQLSFTTVTGLDTVAITTVEQTVTGFAAGVPINRLFKISTSANTYTEPVFRMHYADDDELNGNVEKLDEEGIKPFYSPNGKGDWVSAGKAAYDITLNWVETTKQTNGLEHYWTLSDESLLYKWQGDVDTLWSKAGNWRVVDAAGVESDAITPPTISDIAEFGSITPADNLAGLNGATSTKFFEPVVDVDAKIKIMQYKHRTEIDLNFANTTSSLFVRGNLLPISNDSDPSAVHAIITADKALTVGNLIMDDAKQKINIFKASGEIAVNSVTQNQAQIELGTGTLRIRGNYNFGGTSDKFNSGVGGKVIYEGGNTQTVADVPYYHLEVNKTGGVAQYSTANSPEVRGNMLITTGTMLLQESNTLTVDGNIIIDGVLNANIANIDVKGDWTRSTAGKFIPGTGTVRFIGAGAQSLTGSVFNNLVINNGPAGYATVITSDAIINGNLTISSGKLLLSEAVKANRSAAGGVFEVAAGASLELKGADNFPANYNTNTLASTSKVLYSGTIAQKVKPVVYGKLALLQGETVSKSLDGATSVLDSLILKEDATFDINNQTLTLHGHFVNDGVFSPGIYDQAVSPTGTLILAKPLVLTGTRKNITGKTLTVNNMIISVAAMYNFSAEKLVINGSIDITGNGDVYAKPDEPNPKDREFKQASIFSNGFFETSVDVEIAGDFKNSGMLFSNGKAKFLGGRKQTIQLLAPIIPYNEKAPTVEFAGVVSPTLNSTRSPEFADVIISNTAGVTASVGWGVAGIFTIMPSAKFFAGSYTHKLYSAFLNYGVFESSGILDFSTPYPFADAPEAHPFRFGSFTSTGTLKFGGTGQILLFGDVSPTLNNLVISNSKGITTTTLSPDYVLAIKDWRLNGNLVIESTGKLNAIPEVASKGLIGTNFFIKGDIINQGYIISINPDPLNPVPFGIGANFTMEGPNSNISGSGTTMLGNLTVAPSSKLTINKPVSIYSNLVHNGLEFNSANSLITFIGAGPSSIISGVDPVTPLSLGRLQVFKDTQPMFVNLETDINKVLSVTVAKGTLDLKNKSIVAHPDIEETTTDENGNPVTVIKPVETILTVVDGATIKIGGDKTLPDVDVTALTPASNVIYYGGTQEIKNVQYGNLRLENSLGANEFKTFEAGLTGTTKIAGNFVLDKTAEKAVIRDRVIAPATIEYNGTNQQVAGIDYKSLSLTTGGTKTLDDIVGVAEAFTVEAGKAIAVDATSLSSTVDYNGPLAQNALPLNYHHLTFSNTGIKTLLAGETGIAGDFTVTTPATNLAINTTTVNFNGDRAQKVAAVDYDNLRFSVKGKKTITGTGATVNVKNQLVLSTNTVSPLADNVIEVITGSNRIVLSQASGTISEAENAYVTGTVETTKTTTALQDFGGLGITLNPSASVSKDINVVRVTGTPANTRQVGASILRSFVVNPVGENDDFTGKVVLNYFDHELDLDHDGDAEFIENELVGFYSELFWSDSEWKTFIYSTPNSANNEVTLSNISRLGRYTLGRPTGPNPLPVELIYFKAERNGLDAQLTWETATEEENQGFGVEVSEDGFNYREIGFVSKGTGTTRAATKYSFKDAEQGKTGTRYYRLRQQDYDGKTTYYGPRTLAFEVVRDISVYAYPNPFQNKLQLNISAVAAVDAQVEIYNTAGQKMLKQTHKLKAGVSVLDLNIANSIKQTGIYFVVVRIGGESHRLKLVRE